MRLATFVSPDFASVTTPRPGRCASARCRARACVELTSAAGPEFGDLRPGDASQVVVRRPLCGKHAARWRRDSDAFGPAPRDLAEVFARGDEEVPL